MNSDNYILISGSDQTDIIKALQQFANNYSDTGVAKDIEIYKSKSQDDLFLIKPSLHMDLEI